MEANGACYRTIQGREARGNRGLEATKDGGRREGTEGGRGEEIFGLYVCVVDALTSARIAAILFARRSKSLCAPLRDQGLLQHRDGGAGEIGGKKDDDNIAEVDTPLAPLAAGQSKPPLLLSSSLLAPSCAARRRRHVRYGATLGLGGAGS
eukprot:2259174-Rhodomonas_salina.1